MENKIHLSVKPTKNKNSPEELHELKARAFEHLRHLESNPGVPFHNVPSMAFTNERMEDEGEKEYEKYLGSLVQKK